MTDCASGDLAAPSLSYQGNTSPVTTATRDPGSTSSATAQDQGRMTGKEEDDDDKWGPLLIERGRVLSRAVDDM